MKTTTDIASFLKRLTAVNANLAVSLTMYHDGKAFVVKAASDEARSAYLDDALENLAESMRRRANDMQPVRETKPESKTTSGVAFTWTLNGSSMTPKPANPPLPSIHQAAQQAYQQGHCPSCGGVMAGTMSTAFGSYSYCSLGHYWMKP